MLRMRQAVHCRAGLGRTGTLIALWMMRGTWKAREAIGWLRFACMYVFRGICVYVFIHMLVCMYTEIYIYGVATISRLLKMIGLFGRISSLL